MAEICPRCESGHTAEAHVGREDGVRVWSVWHCNHCAFTWRDTEPPEILDPARRPAWARLEGVDLTQLRHLLPPRRPGSGAPRS